MSVGKSQLFAPPIFLNYYAAIWGIGPGKKLGNGAERKEMRKREKEKWENSLQEFKGGSG